MKNDFFVSLLLIIFSRGVPLSRRILYTYHHITDSCFRKTKAVMAPIRNYVFVFLHIFKGGNRICEMIESFYDLSSLEAIVL